MFLPDNLRPKGYGRNSQRAARRCMLPTCGGGLAAKRAIARSGSASCAMRVPPLRVRSRAPFCKPSITSRSERGKPRSVNNRSSFTEETGSTHGAGVLSTNCSITTERTHRQLR